MFLGEKMLKMSRNASWIEMFLALDGKTAWVIDVWDCHGVLKQRSWGIGKGCTPELPKELEWKNIGEGWFTIPVQYGIELDEKQEDLIEEVLFEVVNRNGMINRSGIYPVFSSDIERMIKAFQKKLKPAKTDDVVDEIVKLLRRSPNEALLVWSSAWGYGCWEGCQGYHQETYLFFDGKKFNSFEYGAHHVTCKGMWDINPTDISEKEVRQLITEFVEETKKDEKIYDDEIECFVGSLDLSSIKLCKKHGYYFDTGYGCEECQYDSLDIFG